jgi:Ca2+-binding EF-hand superfamily protein
MWLRQQLEKALGKSSKLGFNEVSSKLSRSSLMNYTLSGKTSRKQWQTAQKKLVSRHFNTFSVAIITVAALHMSPALAQMNAPAKPSQMSAKLQEAFARADINTDGKLSKEEAAVMPAIAEAFDKADVDKDGFLSKEEFADVAKE